MPGQSSKLYLFLSLLILLVITLLVGEYRLLQHISDIESELDSKLERLTWLANHHERYRVMRVVPPEAREVLYPAHKTFVRGVDTPEEFQHELSRNLRVWMGLDEDLLKRDVEIQVIEREKVDSVGVIREKIEISFRGNERWLLRGFFSYPAEFNGKLPGVLCLNGHRGKATAVVGIEEDYTNGYGLALAKAGCKVLSFDWCFEGESTLVDDVGKVYSGHDSLAAYTARTGHSGLALYMENAYCAFKALKGDPMVDKERIGVTGISRGGELTTYFAALFAPELAAYYSSGAGFPFVYRRFGGGCECTFIEKIFDNYEFSDLMAAAAPMPAALQLGVQDGIWGYWDNIKQIMLTIKPIYEELGAAESFSLDIHPAKHVYDVGQAIRFFKSHLIEGQKSLRTMRRRNK